MSDTKNKVLYYAVNGSGQGVLFTCPPVRDNHFKVWTGETYGVYTRMVMQLESEGLITFRPMSWSDEPIKLELTLNICDD